MSSEGKMGVARNMRRYSRLQSGVEGKIFGKVQKIKIKMEDREYGECIKKAQMKKENGGHQK